MINQTLDFIDVCPAWARKLGIKKLEVWQTAQEVMPFPWYMRFDRLDEQEADHIITGEEKGIIIKLLENWDYIAAKNYDY